MAENNPAMMMMTAVLGQTVRLLPIIGEADKEATYPSPGSTPTLFTLERMGKKRLTLCRLLEQSP